MPLDTERLFRRIWLTNGILLLLLLIGGLGVAAYGILSHLWGSDEHGVRPAPTEGSGSTDIRPRVIRYKEPQRVLNSAWLLIPVHYGSDYGEPSGNSSAELVSAGYARRPRAGGALVNVMFVPPDGGPGRLLLDRPAFIRDMDVPRERPFAGERVDSVPRITYSIAFDDTDRSGRLDYQDAAELYISDLEGGHFRRVLPPGLRVTSTMVLSDRQLLVSALDARGAERKPEDQLPQRAFRFNPRTGELASDVGLDSLAAAAGRILGRP
jgi:hypothetical protein